MPVRVLHVINNLGSGGPENLLLSLLRAIDRDRVQFDFMIRSAEGNFLAEEIERLGGRIFIMPRFPREYFANVKAVDQFFASHPEYQIVHVHAGALVYTVPFAAAKKHGVKCRIVHSHSTDSSAGTIGRLLHQWNRLRIGSWATDFIACSPEAAQWMFGKRPYTYIKNGIDLRRNRFSEATRGNIRTQLGLGDEFVVGHVGRMLPVKNHDFILAVFKQLLQQVPEARLLLVGDGDYQQHVEEQIRQEGLESSVIMTGSVHNVHEYLNAMDTFIFPSLYEGLPLALVEAQANGLPGTISDTVSPASILTDNTRALSLSAPIEIWVQELLERKRNQAAAEASERLQEFDINVIARKLEDFYCSRAAES